MQASCLVALGTYSASSSKAHGTHPLSSTERGQSALSAAFAKFGEVVDCRVWDILDISIHRPTGPIVDYRDRMAGPFHPRDESLLMRQGEQLVHTSLGRVIITD